MAIAKSVLGKSHAGIFMPPTAVAKKLGITRQTLYRWVKDGKIPAYRLGKRCLRFAQVDVNEFVERGSKEKIV